VKSKGWLGQPPFLILSLLLVRVYFVQDLRVMYFDATAFDSLGAAEHEDGSE
jgi:hypothetical protein